VTFSSLFYFFFSVLPHLAKIRSENFMHFSLKEGIFDTGIEDGKGMDKRKEKRKEMVSTCKSF